MEPTLCLTLPGAYTPPTRVLVGRTGLQYTLGEAPLGAGAQAVVWPALREDGLPVAVKLARPERSAFEAIDSEGRYLEALAARGLACAVPCLDRVWCEARPGLVLARLPRDVDALVRARVEAAPERAVEAVLGVGAALARALAALHGADLARPGEPGRLIHRDMKPDNVLVDGQGRIHLADLGGSLLADGVGTRVLGVFGSPLWAPPDQMLPGRAAPNASWDTYAVCVMVFTWLAGVAPSFQRDPRPRLRPRGQEILARMNDMARVRDSRRSAAIEALFAVRDGARARDVVEPGAPLRFDAADRAQLLRGLAGLAPLQVYGDLAVESAAVALVALLERGLSPHATPSPPHRYWRAAELAMGLEEIAAGLGGARRRLTTPRARIERAGAHPLSPAPSSTAAPPPSAARPVVRPAPGRSDRAAASVRTSPVSARSPRGPGWLPLIVVILAALAVWPRTDREPLPDTLTARTLLVNDAAGAPAARIARAPVSTQEYRACVGTGACTPPAWDVPGSAWQLGVGARGAAFGGRVGDEQPVVGVTWAQAAAWCRWAGGALPGEAEWAGAEAALGATTWEWTSTTARDGAARVLRGGAARVVAGGAGASGETRRVEPPERVAPTYGFRCVYPAEGLATR